MSSFFLRVKNVGYLTSKLLKLERITARGNFQKNIHTECVLFSDITSHFTIHENRNASKNSDFGKVVDLDYDFSELRFDETNDRKSEGRTKKSSAKKPRKNKIAKQPIANQNPAEIDDNTDEIESDDGTEIKQNFKLTTDGCNTFRKIMTQIKSKKYRHKEERIILEGKRLIHDAIWAGHRPLNVFFSRFSDLRKLNLPEGIEVTQVAYKTLCIWSDVVTSQGVIGVFKMPELDGSKFCNDAIPLTIICDNIKDPGNLGSILRISTAVGCQELILTKGCVDIWEPKVLRTGAGAHFRLPIVNNLTWSDIENKISEAYQVVLADNEVPLKSSDDLEKVKDEEENAKNNFFRVSSEIANNLPLCCYTSFNFNPSGVVIVLGGETQGLSNEAYQFASSRNGSRVYLPMSNGTESLNSSVSLGILSYEFKRQLTSDKNYETTSDEISVAERQ